MINTQAALSLLCKDHLTSSLQSNEECFTCFILKSCNFDHNNLPGPQQPSGKFKYQTASFSVLVITTKITASKLFTSPTSEVALNPCLSRLIHIVWVWTSMDLCSSWQNGSNCNIIDIDTLTETSSFRDYFYRGSQRTEWELRELLHDSYHHLKLNISKTSEWTADNIVLNMDVFTRRCEF